jgi:DNA invertase Pin-like site-specific DNA recombinase
MLIGVFGAPTQHERTLINERSAAAREATRARGRHVGRPKALTPAPERQIRALHDAGEGAPALVAIFGVSRATVYRLLTERSQRDRVRGDPGAGCQAPWSGTRHGRPARSGAKLAGSGAA